MLWIWLAFAGAVALGITEYLTKRAYKHFDAWSLAWARNIFAIPVFIILLLIEGVPPIQPEFWKFLIVAVPVELVIGIAFFFAIKLTPLSLVLPFTTFSTLFIALGSYFINGEPLKLVYFIAFPLILLGAFFIQEKRSINWRQLSDHKSEVGIMIMIFTTMLFGVAVPVGERIAAASSTFLYLTVNFSAFVLLLTPIFLVKTSNSVAQFRKRRWDLLAIGIFNGIFLGCMWMALKEGPAGSVSAITNLSILIAILLAGTLLQEQGIVRRFIATSLMVSGAALATLG